MRIVPYQECGSDAKRWDDFIASSCNGNFLHSRRFFSYHGDRFTDCSVFLEDETGKLVGLFPAAASGDKTVCSHPGSTYGGIVHQGGGETLFLVENMLDALVGHYRKLGFARMIYKEVPHIYTKVPANEDSYALFRAGFRLERCLLNSVVSPATVFSLSNNRKRGAKKSTNLGAVVRATCSLDEQEQFWRLLEECMWQRHKIKPTHSWQEISRLMKLFPENISFTIAEIEGVLGAGVVLFHFPSVVHAQYICVIERFRKMRVLDGIFIIMCNEASKERKWFSFGVSNNLAGDMNYGLYNYKLGFGAGGVLHNIYHLDV